MTKQADYGIVLMSHLASRSDQCLAATELAAATHIPLPTVSKILKLLTREGLLNSQRGAKGGYSLAKLPAEISVEEMITVLDGPITFTECSDETPGICQQEATCRLKANWRLINEVVRRALAGITLADLGSPLPLSLLKLEGFGIDPSRASSGQIS